MKRIFMLLLSGILIFTGCANNESQEENKTSKSNKQDDGVIDEMSVNELTKKLSMLNENTTKSDMIKIFEKEPYIPIESSSDVYEYFSRNIEIDLWGDPLYQVIVTYNEFSFALDLHVDENDS